MSVSYYVSATLTAAANKPTLLINGNAAKAAIWEFYIGPGAAPSDVANTYNLTRATNAGTTPTQSSLTEEPTNPQFGAAVAIATAGTWATDPAAGNIVYGTFGLHAKMGYRWVAQPGRELVCAIAAANGIYTNTVLAAAAIAMTHTVGWLE